MPAPLLRLPVRQEETVAEREIEVTVIVRASDVEQAIGRFKPWGMQSLDVVRVTSARELPEEG